MTHRKSISANCDELHLKVLSEMKLLLTYSTNITLNFPDYK